MMGEDRSTTMSRAGAEVMTANDMSCLMHQTGCSERLGEAHPRHAHRRDPGGEPV